MEHTLHYDGNKKGISWAITTNNITKSQFRNHADIYLDKVTDQQSKYIALHVGIFWSIGAFIIRNNDTIKVMSDSNSIIEHLTGSNITNDVFLERRKGFINQLIAQRNLKVIFEKNNNQINPASEILNMNT
jgi:predicted RNA-binding protein (virulence factor B family)